MVHDDATQVLLMSPVKHRDIEVGMPCHPRCRAADALPLRDRTPFPSEKYHAAVGFEGSA